MNKKQALERIEQEAPALYDSILDFGLLNRDTHDIQRAYEILRDGDIYIARHRIEHPSFPGEEASTVEDMRLFLARPPLSEHSNHYDIGSNSGIFLMKQRIVIPRHMHPIDRKGLESQIKRMDEFVAGLTLLEEHVSDEINKYCPHSRLYR